MKCTGQIRGQDLVPFFRVKPQEKTTLADAGITDKDVDPRPCVAKMLHHCVHLAAMTNVGLIDRSVPADACNLPDGVFRFVGTLVIVYAHCPARPAELETDRSSDASGRSCHESSPQAKRRR
jgi:hypothetical protein